MSAEVPVSKIRHAARSEPTVDHLNIASIFPWCLSQGLETQMPFDKPLATIRQHITLAFSYFLVNQGQQAGKVTFQACLHLGLNTRVLGVCWCVRINICFLPSRVTLSNTNIKYVVSTVKIGSMFLWRKMAAIWIGSEVAPPPAVCECERKWVNKSSDVIR